MNKVYANSIIDIALAVPRTHPEIKPGEVFVMNMTAGEYRRWKKQKRFKTFRIGKQAYQTTGEKVDTNLHFRPVFYTPK